MTLRADQIIRRLVSTNYSSVVLERFGFVGIGFEVPSLRRAVTGDALSILTEGSVKITLGEVSIVNFGGAIVSASLNSRPYVMVVASSRDSNLKFGVVLDGSRSINQIVSDVHLIIEGE